MRPPFRTLARGLIARSPTLLAVFALLLSSACGKKEAETPPGQSAELETEEDDVDGMEMMQEFGGMNEEKVNKTLKRLYPDLSDCLMKGYDRVDFLGGEVAFLVKVNLSGQAEYAHAERSTLGDFSSEKCMLERIKASKWPKPVGGRIGLARTSIAFDPPSDVRPPVDWSYDDIKDELEGHRDELVACGLRGDYSITAYVSTTGKVMTAGIAHTDDEGDAAAECMVQVLEGITFASPGSWPAKVTFSL